jgi:hypothetical protein
MIYNVNFKKLVQLLLPTFLRKPVIAAFAETMTEPVIAVKFMFDDYRKDVNYRLYHNGQVCYLRAVLNDYFDPILRRITITDADKDMNPSVIFLRSENRFVMIPERQSSSAVILNRRGFSGTSGYDFTINVPTELIDQNNRITAIADIYKLVSKRYSINYI